MIDLLGLYRAVHSVMAEPGHYRAKQIPGFDGHFLARAGNRPSVLLPSLGARHFRPAIELENLSVRFGSTCTVIDGGRRTDGTFTIVSCTSEDAIIQEYFLRIFEKLLTSFSLPVREDQIEDAIDHLTDLFRSLRRPAKRTAAGLFGELLTILRSTDPIIALDAWRIDDQNRFDFAAGNSYLEIKTTATRRRVHEFSYEQCSIPGSGQGVVVSMFVEQIGGGSSIRDLVDEIETRVVRRPDLIRKLHLNVADTLGSDFVISDRARFDRALAIESTMYCRLEEIPAIRGPLPPGVSGVRLRSDLETVRPASLANLRRASQELSWLLPPR